MKRLTLGACLAAAALRLATAAEPEKAAPDARDFGADKIDVSDYPPAERARYPTFMAKCGKCHPAARAINSRFTSQDWKRYIKKMIRRPGSGINEEQALDIYEFLKFYAGRQGQS